MEVIMWMGMSLNGYIAGEDNNEDFISHDCWLAWLEAIREHGCMVWGRKTHQIVKTWPKAYIEDIKGVKAIVVSGDPNYQVSADFKLVNSPQAAIDSLEKQGFTSMVLTGGSTLNTAFAKAGLIDEVILNIEPVIEGKGIPLFKPEDFELKLELIEMKQSKGKTIQFHYIVR